MGRGAHPTSACGRSARSADTYVPLGAATACVLLGEDEILTAMKEILA